MSSKQLSLVLVVLLILAPLVYASFLYPSLPDTIPIHFNAKGEADGWGSKESIFLAPAILGLVSIFVYTLLSNVHKIDPKRYANSDVRVERTFALIVLAFLSGLSLIILYGTAHRGVPFGKLLFSFLGFGFAGMGVYMPRLKQNYFAGFRLPWTLENAENWAATHRLAGKVWVVGGLVQCLSGVLFKESTLFIIFMSITALMVIIPLVFSYSMFRQAKH